MQLTTIRITDPKQLVEVPEENNGYLIVKVGKKRMAKVVGKSLVDSYGEPISEGDILLIWDGITDLKGDRVYTSLLVENRCDFLGGDYDDNYEDISVSSPPFLRKGWLHISDLVSVTEVKRMGTAKDNSYLLS